MKITKSLLLDLWTSHPFIIFRMGLVYYVINYVYNISNNLEFDWYQKLWSVLGYMFIFFLIYILAVVLTPNRASGSPLFLASEIKKNIGEYLTRCFRLKKGCRGLFRYEIKYSDEEQIISHTYYPIDNPQEVIHKIDAFILVLSTINTYGAEEYIEKLSQYRIEAEFMMINKIEIIYETSK